MNCISFPNFCSNLQQPYSTTCLLNLCWICTYYDLYCCLPADWQYHTLYFQWKTYELINNIINPKYPGRSVGCWLKKHSYSTLTRMSFHNISYFQCIAFWGLKQLLKLPCEHKRGAPYLMGCEIITRSRQLKFLMPKIDRRGNTAALAGFFPLEIQSSGGSKIVKAIRVTTDYFIKSNLISGYKKKALSEPEFSQVFKGWIPKWHKSTGISKELSQSQTQNLTQTSVLLISSKKHWETAITLHFLIPLFDHW